MDAVECSWCHKITASATPDPIGDWWCRSCAEGEEACQAKKRAEIAREGIESQP